MEYVVEYSDDFALWFDRQPDDVREAIDIVVRLLEKRGEHLGLPYRWLPATPDTSEPLSSLLVGSDARKLRIFCARDPRGVFVLLQAADCSDPDGIAVGIARAKELFLDHLLELSSR